jgi:protein ImuB
VLWIALHLPLLSLESFAATLAANGDESGAERPIALLEAHRIVSANAAALSLGVKPGLKRATALALAPQIVLGQADPNRDALTLLPVAHAALAFTPSVSLQPALQPGAAADTVLLEVQASLRYFGGLERLRRAIGAALGPLGHRVHTACAATAQGAAILSRVEPPPQCTDLAATRLALQAAPVWLLGPGASIGRPCRAWACATSTICSSCRAPGWRVASARACWSSSTAPSAAAPTRASP